MAQAFVGRLASLEHREVAKSRVKDNDLPAADVAELVDALGSGPSGRKSPWRFESSHPHSSETSVSLFLYICNFLHSCTENRLGQHLSAVFVDTKKPPGVQPGGLIDHQDRESLFAISRDCCELAEVKG